MSTLPRPCSQCGELVTGFDTCEECRPKRKPQRKRTRKERNRTAALDRLSKRLRALSPFCEYPSCTNTDKLELDHIIPISEAPELALEILNCRVYCRTHNRQRSNKVTDAERAIVLNAIAARKRRRTAA